MRATLMYGAGDVRVEELGAGVEGLKRGDLVVAPFVWADNTCDVYCTGHHAALTAGVNARTTVMVVRGRGAIDRVGAARYTAVPMDSGTVMRNITLTGGVAPARAYIEELMPDIISGKVGPGKVLVRP